MQVGVLALGVVKSVRKFHLSICLPNGNVGKANVYDISDKYSELLKAMVESGQIDEKVAGLRDLFEPGQLVRCYIKKSDRLRGDGPSQNSKPSFDVSLNPKLVNKGLSKECCRIRAYFVGAVQSEEDHGYVIDCGIPHVSCFLSTEAANGRKFHLGSLITFRPLVTNNIEFFASGKSRYLLVTADLNKLTDLVLTSTLSVHFGSLLPGTWLTATIKKCSKSGLVAAFSDYLITISRPHVHGDLERYTVNMEITLCLLTVDPGTKKLTGSVLPHLLPQAFLQTEQRLFAPTVAPVGTRFEGCLTKRIDKRTVHLVSPEDERLHLLVHRAHIPSKLTDKSLKKIFAPGQKVSCRVIDYDLLENVLIATMKRKLLKLPFLALSELSPGIKFTAVVSHLSKTGIVVRVEDRFTGLIPYLHASDTPVKRPAERFQSGQTIDCLVLSVDQENNKLLLTAKYSLLNANYPLLGSTEMYSIVAEGKTKNQLFVAFVVDITEQGILVAGLNELRAWLPRRETGLNPDDVLEVSYFRGQVLRVRIIRSLSNKAQSADERRSQFLVSLKASTDDAPPRKRRAKGSHFHIGQIFQAKVAKVQNTGLVVDLHGLNSDASTPSATLGSAFLAFNQISDLEANNTLFAGCMKNIKPGSLLQFGGETRNVVLISTTASTLLVSARPSLLSAAEDLQKDLDNPSSCGIDQRTGFVREFSDLRVGCQYFAWVLHHVDYGIFVQFSGAVRGLAPTRLLMDTYPSKNMNIKELFPIGATVIAKVVELSQSEKRRCLVSLRLNDTYFAEEHYIDGAVRSLKASLLEAAWISKRHDSLSGFRIGEEVEFRIHSLDSATAFGDASRCSISRDSSGRHWVPALAHLTNTEGVNCAAGCVYSGIVCLVDYAATRVEVALSTWILDSVRSRKTTTPLLRYEQKLNAVTLAVRARDMVIVAFSDVAAGHFGVVPARRSFNDVVPNAWVIGHRHEVTYRSQFQPDGSPSPLHLCTLTIYDPVVTSIPTGSVKKSNALQSSLLMSLNPPKASTTLAPNMRLSGLRFIRVVGHTIFFRLPSTSQVVFCRSVNLAPNAKTVRGFHLNPPPVDFEMKQTAVVLFAADEDRLPVTRGCTPPLRSRLPEISFLTTPHVKVGDVVCGQLLRLHPNYWSLRLPGGATGRLHLTAMGQFRSVQPLSLTQGRSGRIQNLRDVASKMKPARFITCRIIGQQMVITEPSLTGDSSSPPQAFYVSTRTEVIRGGLTFWDKRKSMFGVPIDGCVSIRSVNGLLVSLTHTEDILIPIPPLTRRKLMAAGIRFRIGDCLCVRPLRMFNNQLIGELVLDTTSEEDAAFSVTCDGELSGTVRLFLTELLNDVALKADKSRKRSRLISAKSETLSLDFVDEPTEPPAHDVDLDSSGSKRRVTRADNSDFPSPCTKRPRIASPTESSLNSNTSTPTLKPDPHAEDYHVDGPGDLSALDPENWSVANSELVSRYADYMLAPSESSCLVTSADAQMPIEDSKRKKNKKTLSRTVEVNTVTTEWQLRELELRKAMLAALTSEQQRLPAGSLRPTTTEEFELTVRNAPSNAACWTAYMTHVLADGEGIVEARAIAERGLRAIGGSAGLSPHEQETQQAHLLCFYLVMESKELERCLQQQHHLPPNANVDPVLEASHQAERLSQVLSRLVNFDRTQFTRRAIDALADIGHFDRAEEIARRSIKSSPKDLDRWLSLIKLRFRAGRVIAAREAQRNGARVLRTTQLPKFLSSVARMEFELGDADRAISLLRELSIAHPKHRIVFEEFIRVLLLSGKLNEAKSIREKASVTLKPHDCEVLDALFQKSLDTNATPTH